MSRNIELFYCGAPTGWFFLFFVLPLLVVCLLTLPFGVWSRNVNDLRSVAPAALAARGFYDAEFTCYGLNLATGGTVYYFARHGDGRVLYRVSAHYWRGKIQVARITAVDAVSGKRIGEPE